MRPDQGPLPNGERMIECVRAFQRGKESYDEYMDHLSDKGLIVIEQGARLMAQIVRGELVKRRLIRSVGKN